MIRRIKAALEALTALPRILQGLSEALHALVQGSGRDEALLQRVGALEASQHELVAQAEALVTRAESRFHAARASEERARGMVRRAEALQGADGGDEEGEDPFLEFARQLQASHGGGGPEEGMQPMHESMEADLGPAQEKEIARALKHGRV